LRTLAVLSCKGGTGKTTVSIHLAAAATLSGKRTVIADTDPQNSAMAWRRARTLPEPDVRPLNAGALFAFQRSSAQAGADLMVIDTRAAAGDDGAEAARCADLCLIVVRPSFLDIKAVERSVQTVLNLGRPGLVVVNQAPLGRENRLRPETFALLRGLGLPVAEPVLKARVAYQVAVGGGLTAGELAPESPAAIEVADLWRDVAGRLWSESVVGMNPETRARLEDQPLFRRAG
jgi:chromosome partitioning protein